MDQINLTKTMGSDKSIEILGVKVDMINLDELIHCILTIIQDQKKAIVSYINIHALDLSYKGQRLKNFFNNSDIVYCDGYGLQIAAWILGYKSPERNTPPDWIGRLFEICVQNKFKVFFLGSSPGVAEKAAVISSKKYPGLNICGTYHGFFDKSKNCIENNLVIQKINECSPDVLIVGFGMPSQEFWIEDNKMALNATLFMPVGALFDYLSGEVYRAPHWMTDHGFEWMGRLVIEPRRLWKRYILGIPIFFFRVFKELINKKLRK